METQENIIKDSYMSISAHTEGLFKDKGSRFISLAYPVENEEEIKLILDKIKKDYYDARHHCYAYRLGYKKDIYRANDDGEPSSTAGRPILGQIDSAGLSDILIVVIRYFGGIKLGVPGLIRAYKEAAISALEQAEFIEKIATQSFKLVFSYEDMNTVMKVLKDMDLPQYNQYFSLSCSLETKVRLSQVDDFKNRFDYNCSCKIIDT